MTRTDREQIADEEANKIGNQWLGTIALIRKRKLRVLNILGEMDKKPNYREKLALALLDIYTFLERKANYNNTVREGIVIVYSDFDPQKHYAKVRRDNDGTEISRTIIKKKTVPRDLRRARHMFHQCRIHELEVGKWSDSFDTYLDAMYTLTGTALVTSMRDFSKTYQNFSIDQGFASEAAQALPNV